MMKKHLLKWLFRPTLALCAATLLTFSHCGGCNDPGEEITDVSPTDPDLNQSCGAFGQGCTTNDQCCSGICDPNTSSCGANCLPFGAVCQKNIDCCSGACDPNTGKCTQPILCSGVNTACTLGSECCSNACISNKCAVACVSDGAACTSPGACCSGNCASNVCVPLNPGGCKSAGNSCGANTECCSGLCQGGTCSSASSFCRQMNDVCAKDTDCCSNLCTITPGNNLGTCKENSVTAAGGCTIAGTICAGCSTCCSALCIPYASGTTKICALSGGCHVTGELCTRDSDCCGFTGSGLPGDGRVRCVIATGESVGVCRLPTGCNPQGNVCHYTGPITSCGNSRNSCCAAPGNSGECKLDNQGIPRCHGLGTACRAGGQTCSVSSDCCAGSCVPDGSGVLRCQTNNCSPSGGPCTVAGDCCNTGYLCVTAPGSLQGQCTAPTTPDGGTGTDGGTCALYGQGCSVGGTGAKCCNNIQCSKPGGLGTPCQTGDTGCTCYDPVL